MTERTIVEAAARLRRHGEAYLVATVVSVHGSAYRRPGARMLLTRFRWVAGTVSGGSLEGDLSNQGWWRTRDGKPLLLTYGPDGEHAEDDDIRSAFGLGCDGVVEVLLERAGTPGRIDALDVAARSLQAQKRGAVATVFRSDDPSIRIGARLALVDGGELETERANVLDPAIETQIATDLRRAIAMGTSRGRSYATANGTIEVFVEAILPPQRLILCGTGHDAVPVAQLARTLGWDVIVYASQPRFSTRERFTMATEVITERDELLARIAQSDRAIGIVMTHEAARDREHLALLLTTKVDAIGVLGTPDRAASLTADLGMTSLDPRVHAVGLTLGAETPQEIAMAMIGELQGALVKAATPESDGEPVVEVAEATSPRRARMSTGSVAAIAAAAAP